MQPFTSEQIAAVRARLAERGETVQDFCQQQGLSYHVVMALLHQRSAGSRGEGHRAAVLIGLKRQPPKKRKAARPMNGQIEPQPERRVGLPDRRANLPDRRVADRRGSKIAPQAAA